MAIAGYAFATLIPSPAIHSAHIFLSRILPKSLVKFSQLHIAITVKKAT
jgi:hypothetical protein